MLTAHCVLPAKVRLSIEYHRVVRNRLFGPGRVFWKIVSTTLLSNINESNEPVILYDLITLLVE